MAAFENENTLENVDANDSESSYNLSVRESPITDNLLDISPTKILCKEQAKRRLFAFKSNSVSSPSKKYSKPKEPLQSEGKQKEIEKKIKKAKKPPNPTEKAKMVMEEINEIKKLESDYAEELTYKLGLNRKHSKKEHKQNHSEQKFKNRSSSKYKPPTNWKEFRDENVDLHQENHHSRQNNYSDFRRQLLFDDPSLPINSFTYKSANGADSKVPAEYLRLTTQLPIIAYSSTVRVPNDFYSRKNVLEYIPKKIRKQMHKIIKSESKHKDSGSSVKRNSRSWYPKDFVTFDGTDCQVLENTLSLSLLQTYSDDEEITRENVETSKKKKKKRAKSNDSQISKRDKSSDRKKSDSHEKSGKRRKDAESKERRSYSQENNPYESYKNEKSEPIRSRSKTRKNRRKKSHKNKKNKLSRSTSNSSSHYKESKKNSSIECSKLRSNSPEINHKRSSKSRRQDFIDMRSISRETDREEAHKIEKDVPLLLKPKLQENHRETSCKAQKEEPIKPRSNSKENHREESYKPIKEESIIKSGSNSRENHHETRKYLREELKKPRSNSRENHREEAKKIQKEELMSPKLPPRETPRKESKKPRSNSREIYGEECKVPKKEEEITKQKSDSRESHKTRKKEPEEQKSKSLKSRLEESHPAKKDEVTKQRSKSRETHWEESRKPTEVVKQRSKSPETLHVDHHKCKEKVQKVDMEVAGDKQKNTERPFSENLKIQKEIGKLDEKEIEVDAVQSEELKNAEVKDETVNPETKEKNSKKASEKKKSRKASKSSKIKCVAEVEFGTPDTDDYRSNWESDEDLCNSKTIANSTADGGMSWERDLLQNISVDEPLEASNRSERNKSPVRELRTYNRYKNESKCHSNDLDANLSPISPPLPADDFFPPNNRFSFRDQADDRRKSRHLIDNNLPQQSSPLPSLLEIPLNIRSRNSYPPVNWDEHRFERNSYSSPKGKFSIFTEDSWERDDYLTIKTEELRLAEERRTLAEERRLLEIEKRKLEELEMQRYLEIEKQKFEDLRTQSQYNFSDTERNRHWQNLNYREFDDSRRIKRRSTERSQESERLYFGPENFPVETRNKKKRRWDSPGSILEDIQPKSIALKSNSRSSKEKDIWESSENEESSKMLKKGRTKKKEKRRWNSPGLALDDIQPRTAALKSASRSSNEIDKWESSDNEDSSKVFKKGNKAMKRKRHWSSPDLALEDIHPRIVALKSDSRSSNEKDKWEGSENKICGKVLKKGKKEKKKKRRWNNPGLALEDIQQRTVALKGDSRSSKEKDKWESSENEENRKVLKKESKKRSKKGKQRRKQSKEKPRTDSLIDNFDLSDKALKAQKPELLETEYEKFMKALEQETMNNIIPPFKEKKERKKKRRKRRRDSSSSSSSSTSSSSTSSGWTSSNSSSSSLSDSSLSSLELKKKKKTSRRKLKKRKSKKVIKKQCKEEFPELIKCKKGANLNISNLSLPQLMEDVKPPLPVPSPIIKESFNNLHNIMTNLEALNSPAPFISSPLIVKENSMDSLKMSTDVSNLKPSTELSVIKTEPVTPVEKKIKLICPEGNLIPAKFLTNTVRKEPPAKIVPRAVIKVEKKQDDLPAPLPPPPPPPPEKKIEQPPKEIVAVQVEKSIKKDEKEVSCRIAGEKSVKKDGKEADCRVGVVKSAKKEEKEVGCRMGVEKSAKKEEKEVSCKVGVEKSGKKEETEVGCRVEVEKSAKKEEKEVGCRMGVEKSTKKEEKEVACRVVELEKISSRSPSLRRRESLSPRRERRLSRSPRRYNSSSRFRDRRRDRSRSRSISPRRRYSRSPRRSYGNTRRSRMGRFDSPPKRYSISPRRKEYGLGLGLGVRSPRRRSISRDSSPRRISSIDQSSNKERRKETIQETLARIAGVDKYSKTLTLSPISSPLHGFKRSVADSTISDDQLLQSNTEEFTHSPSVTGSLPKSISASPKRVSLDERINQVLGITEEPKPVAEEPKPISTIYSLSSNEFDPCYNIYNESGRFYDNYRVSYNKDRRSEPSNLKVLQIRNNLQVIPIDDTKEKPPPAPPVQQNKVTNSTQKIVHAGNTNSTKKIVQAGNTNSTQKIVQAGNTNSTQKIVQAGNTNSTQKIVQVGNVLQIVPMPISLEEKSSPVLPPPDKQNTTKILPVSTPSPLGVSPLNAEVLIKQKSERRAEKLKRKQERDKKRKDKEKKRKEKEKRKQLKVKLQTEAMIKQALSEDILNDELENESQTLSQWPPLPQVVFSGLQKSPGKGILNRSNQEEDDSAVIVIRKRKNVTFSDGIMPGEGTSPSGGEELSSPPPSKLPKEKRFKKTKLPKPAKVPKKKVKVKVIRQQLLEGNDEEDNLPPPPPPPGSPPPHIFPVRIKQHINNIHPKVISSVQNPVLNYQPQTIYQAPQQQSPLIMSHHHHHHHMMPNYGPPPMHGHHTTCPPPTCPPPPIQVYHPPPQVIIPPVISVCEPPRRGLVRSIVHNAVHGHHHHHHHHHRRHHHC